MSKDPAFLFYSSDFLTGTYTMTDEQVGKYVRLLCLQHQQGHITEKDMKKICGTYDKDIYNKFTKDETGMYYNERLDEEVTKRKKYSESRKNNRLGKNICSTYVNHMENVNENENENEDDNNNTAPKKFIPPTLDEVKAYFKQEGYLEEMAIRAFKGYDVAGWKDSKGKPIKSWKQKMIHVWFKEENKIPKKSEISGL